MKKYLEISFLGLLLLGAIFAFPSLSSAQYVNGVWTSTSPYYVGPAPSYPVYLAPGVSLLPGYDAATINPDALATLEAIYAADGKYLVGIPGGFGFAVVPDGWTSDYTPPPSTTPTPCAPGDTYDYRDGSLCPGSTPPSTTTPPITTTPTTGALIDIKANSSDGPITLTAGQALNLWWTSTRTGPCTLKSTQNTSGSSVSPTSSVVYSPGTALYPTVTTTYTITCY